MSDFDRERESQHMDMDKNEPWQIVKQTEGLDADQTRKVAGPDWDPSTQGDLEADESAGSAGSGATGDVNQNEETERTL